MNLALNAEARAAYTAWFGDSLQGEHAGPVWLRALRQEAFDTFLAAGWPTTKQEAWRFTDLSPLLKTPLVPGPSSTTELDFDDRLVRMERLGYALRFVDGQPASPRQAGPLPPAGVRLLPLAAAVERSDGETRRIAQVLGHHLPSPDAFTALNAAFMSDGAFVEIPPGLTLEAPIVLLYLAGAEGSASFPRTVVVAGAASRATIVEIHLGARGRASLSNAVTEVVLEAGAHLDYHTINQPSGSGFHVGHLAVSQGAGSALSAQSVVLGGRLVRNDAHVVLAAEGCTCRLDGLYLATGDSHVDNQTSIDHRAPRCQSRESYRGAVSGRGQAVWSGRAVVRPGAQGTDARQSNRNLVLSEGAVVHAKPHLEIFANDVKCSHGATTGQLDPDALFYLRSRGLSEPEARHLLVEAFLREGLGAVREAGLRGELEALVATSARALVQEGEHP
jgi:Fe-S cluster assembly protein SufD